MEKRDIKRFAIYSRKSRFTGQGESIENQIEMCKKYISMNYSQEKADAALIYEDEGFSGGTLDRPMFKKMMKDSQNNQFDAIVVYRLDRISRNVSDFSNLIESLDNHHIVFLSISEQFETSNSMGRAMMYIASVFSQLERETIAERIRDNMYELAKTGRWLGGTTPTGYKSESVSNVTIDGKSHKACKLKTIPEEINLVKLIFDKYIENGSLTKTEQFLLEGGYHTKRDNLFTRFAIRGILANPVYMTADDDAYNYLTEQKVNLYSDKSAFDGKHGIMAYNRTLQRHGKSAQQRPMSEWIVSIGKHKGVISGATWIKVQQMLELNKSKSYRKPRSNVALLSGILYCANCGAYMRPKLTDRLTATGDRIYTYLCKTKEHSRSHLCTMKNADGNLLDAKAIEVIKQFGKQSPEMAKTITQAKKDINRNREGYDSEIANIKKQITENENTINRLVVTLGKAEGTNSEPYILQQIDKLHNNSEALKKRLTELEVLTTKHELSDIEFDLIKQLLSTMSENIDNYSVEQKRAAIRTFIRKIVWDGKNASFYLFYNDAEYEFPNQPIRAKKTADCENPSREDSK